MRKNLSHKNTQSRPTAPVATNDIRQPVLSTSQATMGADTAGPAKVPALKIAVANPRSLAGNHCLTTLPDVGKDAASPTPNTSIVANILPKPTAAPVSMAATDHKDTENPLTLRVPTRSTVQPHGMRQRQYVHIKDERMSPVVPAFQLNSLAMTGAATARLVRSM